LHRYIARFAGAHSHAHAGHCGEVSHEL
jgi:hypothetical protein